MVSLNPLRFGDRLAFPVEVVTKKLAFLGITGSGKTYGASKLAELMLDIHAQVIVLDPVGVWYGLRLKANGKPTGFPIPVLGGLHGDIPLEPTAGAIIADLIVDRNLSAVLDVSQMIPTELARFGRDFAARFFQRKKAAPSAVHLFLDECQDFIPQKPMERTEVQMLSAFTRIAKQGRNFGIGLSFISQRPAEVNKSVLNLAECLLAFQMNGPQERATVQDWIQSKGLSTDVRNVLPTLAVGCPHVWSPQWLGISHVVKVHRKITYDASATPKVGAIKRATQSLGSIDLAQLKRQMDETIERANENDPEFLHGQIDKLTKEVSGLKAQLRAKPSAPPPAPAAIDPAALAEIVRLEADAAANEVRGGCKALLLQLANGEMRSTRYDEKRLRESTTARVRKLLGRFPIPPAEFQRQLTERVLGFTPPTRPARPTTRPAPAEATKLLKGLTKANEEVARNSEQPALSKPQRRLLDAIAYFNSVGVGEPTRAQIALLSDIAPRSSGLDNNISILRGHQLLEYAKDKRVFLTPLGRAVAVVPNPPPTSEDVHRMLESKLSTPQWEILEQLIRSYPEPMQRDDVARAVNKSPSSSGVDNNMSELRSAGLVDYPNSKSIVALPILFLES